MNIGFYLDEMNFRGVANSTYNYAFYNQKILKNKSIIFYESVNLNHQKSVINKFKKSFMLIKVKNFWKIENFKKKLNLDYIYIQKSGNIDNYHFNNIKTIVHALYPQKIRSLHGHKYAYCSEWLSNKFTNNKINYVPYIVNLNKTKKNLKKKLKIDKNEIVFGYHGGESSFDLKFVIDVVKKIVNKRKDIKFIFLNINKFTDHPQVIFLKGTANEKFKKMFLNTCDAMIYARSLGESFGLSCAEFSSVKKKIIYYKFNRHRCHIYNLSKDYLIEYSSAKTLYKIFDNFKKKNFLNKKNYNKYLEYTPNNVMKIFKKVFLNKKNVQINISVYDKFLNFYNLLLVNFNYVRHKIYSYYYTYLESKL